MSREDEALRRWLYEAWDLGVDTAYIVHQLQGGSMSLEDAVREIGRLFGKTDGQEMGERLGLFEVLPSVT